MKKGLVFVNIGTPEDLTVGAVRTYLKKFLMDPFVIDIPYVFRWILVNVVIAPFRAKKSLEAYKEIWQKEGSPLKIYTEELVKTSSKKLGNEWKVTYAMNYSSPYIPETLDSMKDCDEIYYLPMYPQYAESSTRSSLEELEKWKKKNSSLKVKSLNYYFNSPSFLTASANKIKTQMDTDESVHYLFSFHGLPARHMRKLHPAVCENKNSCCETWSEKNELCYRSQCFQTARLLSGQAGLKNYSFSFQSRLGREQWISPYTVDEVKRLAKAGVKKIMVIPYAFTIDCLETEEEIENEIREAFLQAGGEELKRIECLNSDFSNVLDDRFFKLFK